MSAVLDFRRSVVAVSAGALLAYGGAVGTTPPLKMSYRVPTTQEPDGFLVFVGGEGASNIVSTLPEADVPMTDEEWERGEIAASTYLARGEIEVFDGPEDFLAALG